MNVKNINLGKITANDFKESNSVAIAKRLIEKNHKLKTYFSEMDKRPNLDGNMSIIDKENYEKVIIDVQIKTLPENYICTSNRCHQYFYDCDTKVFNVVRLNLTLNPVVLILVDIKKEKVYYLILTKQFVSNLRINSESKKRIFFGEENEFIDDNLICDIYQYNKILNSDTQLIVYSNEIRKELHRKKKLHHKNDSIDYYKLVYERKNIRGYLSNFIWDADKPVNICLLRMYDILEDKEEYIQLFMDKNLIHLNRSIQRNSASDTDVVNILYEVGLFCKKEVLFKSAGEPVYFIDRKSFTGDIWRLKAEKIEKDW